MLKLAACLLKTPAGPIFIPLAISRIAYGLFFAASGFNKVFVAKNGAAMLETLTEAGIPFPGVMAVFVSWCEFLFGLLLAVGLSARKSAAVLLIINIVALVTVSIHTIPPNLGLIAWYSWLLYLPESLYILLSITICVQGAGPFSIDRRLYERMKGNSKALSGAA